MAAKLRLHVQVFNPQAGAAVFGRKGGRHSCHSAQQPVRRGKDIAGQERRIAETKGQIAPENVFRAVAQHGRGGIKTRIMASTSPSSFACMALMIYSGTVVSLVIVKPSQTFFRGKHAA